MKRYALVVPISAWIWARTFLAVCILLVIAGVSSSIMLVVGAAWDVPFAATVILIVVSYAVEAAFKRADQRERRAGYTTLRLKYQEFDQVDPRTGIVVRPVGEPFLSHAEWEARAQRAR
ncbi:hypothetical protein IFU11_14755 [Plantibacter sp. CFBP 8804]|nr:hypothetical protein [Plantibacter sp. CFBP 8804]